MLPYDTSRAAMFYFNKSLLPLSFKLHSSFDIFLINVTLTIFPWAIP